MTSTSTSGLTRQMGLAGLSATGICSMIGASIYVVPFMIQRNVPGHWSLRITSFYIRSNTSYSRGASLCDFGFGYAARRR